MYRDFKAYRNILAICPRDRFSSWAIVDHDTGKLISCGVAKPCEGTSVVQRPDAVKNVLASVWQKKVGSSRSPFVLAIEKKELEDQATLSQIRTLTTHATFVGMVCENFKAYRFYPEKKSEWMFTHNVTYFEAKVLSNLDPVEKRKLVKAVQDHGLRYRTSIFQAIAFGRWAQKRFHMESHHHDIFTAETSRAGAIR